MDAESVPDKITTRVLAVMGSAAGGAIIWCTVGLGVAALISSLVIIVWAIYVFVVAWRSAALLGAIHGSWMCLEGGSWSDPRKPLRFGMLSGALLGLLGFAPSYIQTGILPSHGWWDIVIYLAAAFLGGMAAGGVNARVFAARPRLQATSGHKRRVGTACLLMLAGGLLEYSLYWPPLVQKLPIVRLDETSVANLPAGDARGKAWSGCFQYNGNFFWSSGVVGTEGGLAYVKQDDGALEISLGGDKPKLTGGADMSGQFWTGGQASIGPDETVRVQMKGKFLDQDHLEYSLRRTYLKGASFGNTTRVDGTGSRCTQP